VLPSGTQSKVEAIWVSGKPAQVAAAGQAVAIGLRDERDLERGALLAAPSADLKPYSQVQAQLVWFDGEPLQAAQRYLVKLGTQAARAEITDIKHRYDLQTLQAVPATTLAMNDIAEVSVHFSRALFGKPFGADKQAGAFILIDPQTLRTVAAGMVLGDSEAANRSRQRWQVVKELPAGEVMTGRTLLVSQALLARHSLATQSALCLELLASGWSLIIEDGPTVAALVGVLPRVDEHL
jgi:sulfate adenylyltransferase subunit 1 (EFTu-like GTPase family)